MLPRRAAFAAVPRWFLPAVLAPLAALAALAFLAAPAAAQTPVLTLSMAPPEPLMPGAEGEGALAVHYCYSTTSAVPASIDVSVSSAPAWLTATLDPDRFSGTTSGGSKCGDQRVQVHLAASRAIPAFKPEDLGLHVHARSASGGTADKDMSVPVQGLYWAELSAQAPARIDVKRGESGALRLPLGIGANAGTRLEVTGTADPQGRVTVKGELPPTTAGKGLDDVDHIVVSLQVAVAPSAEVGVHQVQIHITTRYAQGSDVGEEKTVQGEVNVPATSSPGPEPWMAGLALAGAAAVAAWFRRAAR